TRDYAGRGVDSAWFGGLIVGHRKLYPSSSLALTAVWRIDDRDSEIYCRGPCSMMRLKSGLKSR
ncbi:MAG TPA: hypothetical protein VF772_15245, partial [Terriglobales bacterium]